MKIAVFIKSTTFHKGYGGMETQNRLLCEELVNRGHTVYVFSPKRDVQQSEESLNEVKYVFIDSDYGNYLLSFLRRNSWTRKSVNEFSKYNSEKSFDLVISQSSAGEGIIRNKEKLAVKVLSIAHGTTISEYKTFFKNIKSVKDIYWALRNTQYVLRQYFGRQRRYILGSNKIVAVSDYIKKSLIEETFCPEDKIHVVYNGMNPDNFPKIRVEKNSDKIKLIFVGRIDKSKGVFILVDLVSDLKDKNVLLSFVGDGDDLENLKKYSKEKNVYDLIDFKGKLSDQREVIRELSLSDIFVFPSQRIEGFPMTLPEAMFSYLPIVATDMGGITSAIEESKTGFLVGQKDYKLFKERTLFLIENESERIRMGDNARIKADKEFTIKTMVDRYEEIIMEILK